MEAAWLHGLVQRLQESARPPLPADLIPLRIAGVRVGLVQPTVADFVAQQVTGFALNNGELTLCDDTLDTGARTALLAYAATSLHSAGFITGWRDEVLAVGRPAVATIERAACRPFGITTEAVHLNAYAGAALYVARRAPHKQIDPNRWDNLVGGMVAAGESLQNTLEREAFEEAGLQLTEIQLQRGRSFQMRRPVPEGLQSEIIHVFDAELPAGVVLKNEDGEVAAIECRTIDQIVDAIERDEFTIESALVTLESLTRRSDNDFFRYDASSIHAA